MARLRTHYDNLKVSRDAPPEVIRAAYRTLSQRYHPDRNPGNRKEAERIMKILNAAYEVLSDPVRRRAHDDWIAQQEAAMGATAPANDSIRVEPRVRPESARQSASPSDESIGRGIGVHVTVFVLLAIFIWSGVQLVNDSTPTKPYRRTPPSLVQPSPELPLWPVPEPEPFATPIPEPTLPAPQIALPSVPQYVRPQLAPNGRPWPTRAGYLSDMPILNTDGYCKVQIDNSGNSSDVHVKLVDMSEAVAYPVREIYIPAGSRFTATNLSAGTYQVRYRDLMTGALARTESFELTETRHGDRIRSSVAIWTLYKVVDGNAQLYPIDENQF